MPVELPTEYSGKKIVFYIVGSETLERMPRIYFSALVLYHIDFAIDVKRATH